MIVSATVYALVALFVGAFLLLRQTSRTDVLVFAVLLISLGALVFGCLGYAKPKWLLGPMLHEELTLVTAWPDEANKVIYLLVLPLGAEKPQTIYIPYDPNTAEQIQNDLSGAAVGRSREIRIRLDGAEPHFTIVDPPALPPKNQGD